MKLTDELEEYQASQEKLFLVQKEVTDKIEREIREATDAGRAQHIILDSFLQRVAEEHHITPREAHMTIVRAIEASGGLLITDGTVIKYRWRLLRCLNCAARYSEALRNCPSCGKASI